MNRQQVIYAGKLLVHYKLLKNGLTSSINFENRDIHLKVASRTITVNVKTTEGPKPGGGKGKDALSWGLGKTDANYIACVNLADDEVWLFTSSEMYKLAQHPSKDKLYIYTDETVKARKKALRSEFRGYLLENWIKKIRL